MQQKLYQKSIYVQHNLHFYFISLVDQNLDHMLNNFRSYERIYKSSPPPRICKDKIFQYNDLQGKLIDCDYIIAKRFDPSLEKKSWICALKCINRGRLCSSYMQYLIDKIKSLTITILSTNATLYHKRMYHWK